MTPSEIGSCVAVRFLAWSLIHAISSLVTSLVSAMIRKRTLLQNLTKKGVVNNFEICYCQYPYYFGILRIATAENRHIFFSCLYLRNSIPDS